MWADLFGAMRCTRDRALLACYVHPGRGPASYCWAEDIDWPGMRLWVARKGSDVLTAVPISPDAAALLAVYLTEAGLPSPAHRYGGPAVASPGR